MKVSIIGLGYVGTVSTACLANEGHKIFGVDTNQDKVDLINSGSSPIIEDRLDDLIKSGINSGNIEASTDLNRAIIESEIAVICLGTPNLANGDLDMSIIYDVINKIANILIIKETFLTISIRSTVMPGTNDYLKKLIENISGKKSSIDFAVISNPEFLREGSAVIDFYNPPYTVVSGDCDFGRSQIKKMFNFLKQPFYEPDINVAELIKFLNNSFHALKVGFANEVGRLCKEMEIDSHELMNLFIQDTHLNISNKYLMPGLSYGGSCLPKDLKALNTLAHEYSMSIPIFDSIEKSNSQHTSHIIDKIKGKNKNKIGFIGLSFKAGTDDLRFSPSLEICEKLISEGYVVSIYDESINLSRLIGKNKDYLNFHLPQVENCLTKDLEKLIKSNEVIVFFHDNLEASKLIINLNPNIIILDLVNIKNLKIFTNYDGIGW